MAQKIVLVQQNGAGISKAEGIKRFGGGQFEIETVDIEADLPPVVDDAACYLPDRIEADVVLDFLTHPDVSEDLSVYCEHLGIPVVASGKKITRGSAICPPT